MLSPTLPLHHHKNPRYQVQNQSELGINIIAKKTKLKSKSNCTINAHTHKRYIQTQNIYI